MASGDRARGSQSQARSVPGAKGIYSFSPLCLQKGISPGINYSPGESGLGPRSKFSCGHRGKGKLGCISLFPPLREPVRMIFWRRVPIGSPSPPRSMTDAPDGEGRVIDARIERLICSCQTGCQSGRYLGPKEKIKADKAFALALGRELMGARGGKSSAPRALP